jgi:hypothetical protein
LKDSPEGCTCVYIYRKAGEGGIELNRDPYLQQYVTLKVRLNDKVAGPSQLGQKQRMIALLCAAFK